MIIVVGSRKAERHGAGAMAESFAAWYSGTRSDDGAAVEGGAGGRQTDRGRETKADVRLGMGF